MSLGQFIEQTAKALLAELGVEKSDTVVEQLANRWRGGRIVLHPVDATLQTKEVPLDVFFHKVVMVRNNLRVLEQKINSHTALSDADKVELQQYITRSYGSLTTFNLLFKNKQDQFKGAE
jgi:superoxide dismutase